MPKRKLAVTDAQIYLMMFVLGVIVGVTFFQMKNDSVYPAMRLYQELRTDKLKRSDIISAELLVYVTFERFKEFGILFLTQITTLRRIASYIYCGVYGFAFAVLESFYVQQYGIRGMFVFAVSLMPHYIFYIATWFKVCSTDITSMHINRKNIADLLRFFAVVIVFLIVGIISESIINILLLKNFL